jgi:hypothetical protein
LGALARLGSLPRKAAPLLSFVLIPAATDIPRFYCRSRSASVQS